ncbi:uncharacterized protein [Elaeis guineensis]|uniref:Uncharacterized protein LOC105032970 isoform X2 n=1 Tax=Elaeis guineensis var. tenera TaxID=51953 RepID=A0A8N4ETM1_ELAGV|nr:uncharacterized protein LOC105032970 isoform X2 [Elaeis guineensis]
MWRHDASPRNREPVQSLSDDDELHEVTYDHDCSNNLQSLYSHGKKKLAVSSSRYDVGMNWFEDENPAAVQSQPRKVQYSDSGDESISDEENAEFTRLSFTSAAAKVQGSYNYNFEGRNQDEACASSAVREQVNELACLHTKTPSPSIPSDVYEVKKGHRSMYLHFLFVFFILKFCDNFISETGGTIAFISRGIDWICNPLLKVGRGRAKPKFSIHSQSHDEELPWFHEVKGRNEDFSKEVSEGPERQNYFEHRPSGNLMTELLENLQKENDELPAGLLAHEQRGALLSISELLDNLQDKDVQSNGASNLLLQHAKTKNKRAYFAGKRMLPNLGTRTLDDEDPLEVIVGGMSSEDEEVDQNHLSLATQKSKGQTMTDLFQEAFNSSTMEGPLFPTSWQAGAGYHERLQQVMQIEKEKHVEFLKQLQTGQSPLSGSRCMNVQILSRSLEGKLTVCRCLLDESNKSSSCGKGSHKCTDDRGTLKRTVIFSSKVCDNVELDVGNLVRIHPPWKEVQVSKDEKIILCTYFSLVMA